MVTDAPRVGVLTVQGNFARHARALAALHVRAEPVARSRDLAAVDALVLPGGESTAIRHGLRRDGLETAVADALARGLPALGTCAGAILLARGTDALGPASLDIDVERNAYGTQRDSFTATLEAPASGTAIEASTETKGHGAAAGFPFADFRAHLIRAPRITRVGVGVRVLARVMGAPACVAAANRSAPLWACTFHPELGGDDRVLRAWLAEVARSAAGVAGVR